MTTILLTIIALALLPIALIVTWYLFIFLLSAIRILLPVVIVLGLLAYLWLNGVITMPVVIGFIMFVGLIAIMSKFIPYFIAIAIYLAVSLKGESQ